MCCGSATCGNVWTCAFCGHKLEIKCGVAIWDNVNQNIVPIAVTTMDAEHVIWRHFLQSKGRQAISKKGNENASSLYCLSTLGTLQAAPSLLSPVVGHLMLDGSPALWPCA